MQSLLRSIAAVMAGFGFMVATVFVGTMVASALFVSGGPGGVQGPTATAPALPSLYLAANLWTSAMGAVFGGWLAARIATHAPFAHAAALAAVVATVAIVSAMSAPSPFQPRWYGPVISLIGVGGVLLGGSLRAAASQASA